MTKILRLLLSLGLFLLAGCAANQMSVPLTYNQLDLSRKEQSGRITVVQPSRVLVHKNARDQWLIGVFNNANGVYQGDITTEADIPLWINNAIRLELRNAGYTVVDNSSTSAGEWAVQAANIDMSMQVIRGTVSDSVKHELKLDIDLYEKGVLVKSFTVAARDSSKLLSATEEKVRDIIAASLRDAMQQLIPSVLAHLESKR